MSFKHTDITEGIIKAYYTVYNTLGDGFLEKVYQNAMTVELRKIGLSVTPGVRIAAYYNGELVGEYSADLVVAEAVIVELKAARALLEEHEAQLLNYLKATPYEVGLLFNFGPKPDFKRKAFDNARKGAMGWLEDNPSDSGRR